MCLNVKIILVITEVVTSNSNASVDFLTNTYENANYYDAIEYDSFNRDTIIEMRR